MKKLLSLFLTLLAVSSLEAMEVGRFQSTGTSAVIISSQTGGAQNQTSSKNCLTSLDLSNGSNVTCSMEVDDGLVKIWQVDLSSNTVNFGKTWLPGGYGLCGSRGQALTINGTCSGFRIDALGTMEQ